MRRTIILLLLLAVATIFATTSCKGRAILGGPGLPPGEGKQWIDLGDGWVLLDRLPKSCQMEKPELSVSFLVSNPAQFFSEEELTQLTPLAVGEQIRFGARLSPTERLQQKEIASLLSQTILCPLSRQEGRHEYYGYFCDKDNAQKYSEDKSRISDQVAELCYIWEDIPPSPSGYYVLVFYAGFDVGLILLQHH